MNVDRESLEELVRTADTEGFLAEGAPQDEYDLEINIVWKELKALPEDERSEPHLLTLFEETWRRAFTLSHHQLEQRRPAFEQIVRQLLHHFG